MTANRLLPTSQLLQCVYCVNVIIFVRHLILISAAATNHFFFSVNETISSQLCQTFHKTLFISHIVFLFSISVYLYNLLFYLQFAINLDCCLKLIRFFGKVTQVVLNSIDREQNWYQKFNHFRILTTKKINWMWNFRSIDAYHIDLLIGADNKTFRR